MNNKYPNWPLFVRFISGLSLAVVLLAPQLIYGRPAGCIDTPGISDGPPKRAHHAMVYDEVNKRILMAEGSTPIDNGKSGMFFGDLWSFNGKAWTKMDTTGEKRSGAGLAFNSKDGKVYSFGGYTDNGSVNDLRVLENNHWKTISTLPEMKAAEPGVVYDADRNKLVVFGGSPGRGIVNSETWEWDGTAWHKFNGPGPEGRQGFSMVYDLKRKKTILFGGSGTALEAAFNDTWEFDGAGWTKVAETGPGKRLGFGYAYDSKRGELIIFGGILNGKISGDTWAWDGKDWKQVATTGPIPRIMGYMAYDKQRDRIVLFGGRKSWPNDLNDTWEWDGERWKEVGVE